MTKEPLLGAETSSGAATSISMSPDTGNLLSLAPLAATSTRLLERTNHATYRPDMLWLDTPVIPLW